MAGEFRHKDVVAGRVREVEYEHINQHILNNQATGDIVHATSAAQLGRLAVGATDTILSVQGGLPGWRTPADILTDLSGQAGAAFDWGGQNLTNLVSLDGAGVINIRPNSDTDDYISFESLSNIPTIKGIGSYLRVGDANTTSHALASEDDFLITGVLEVNGVMYNDGGIESSANLNFAVNDKGLFAANNDNNFATINARDTGVGRIEVARFAGGADPYFQAGRDDTGVADGSVTDNLWILGGRGALASANETGVGVAFYLGNDQATPENEKRGAINSVLTDQTNGAERSRFDFWLQAGAALARVMSIKDSGIAIVEKAAASPDIAGEGQFWVKNTSPNEPYFTNDDGDDKQLAVFDADTGEMIVTSNQTATIETADTPHAFTKFSTGDVQDFSFVAGITGAITAYADYSGTVANAIKATCVGHGLVTNDIITIRGTAGPNDYNGIWQITRIDDDNFYFVEAALWNADAGASDFEMGDYLLAGVGTAGEYDIAWNSSVSEGGGAGSVVLFCPMQNTTILTKASAKRKFANNDVGSISGGGHIAIAVADRIWFTHQSDGTNDLTVNLMDFRLARLA